MPCVESALVAPGTLSIKEKREPQGIKKDHQLAVSKKLKNDSP